jgi:competence protein ComGC
MEPKMLPQIVLDYVESVIRKMKYRRKVRQEVKAELVSHFEDALRSVEGADKQKKAEGLIRDFGDAKVLAVLIRRGKKRCRPMWQKAIIHGFQAIGVMILLLVLYIGWFFTGKPVITTNYVEKMNQLVRPVADDSQNAWPFYKKAVAEYKKPDANDFKLEPQKLTGLDDSQRRIVEKWLTDNQKAMNLIRQGNQKPYYWQTYSADSEQGGYPAMLAVLLPNFKEYKKLAQLLCWDAYEKAQKGNAEEAMNIAIEVYDFGKHIRGQNTTLIEQLVGIAIEAMACKTLTEIPADCKMDSATLASVQQNLEKILAAENFRISLKGEKLLLYDEIQRCFTQSRFGKSHLYLQRIYRLDSDRPEGSMTDMFDILLAHPGILFTHPNRQKTLDDAERFYAMAEKSAAMTPATRKQQRCDFGEQIEEGIEDNILLNLLIPALGQIVERGCLNQGYSEATMVILAVRRYKLDKGQFSASLEELVKDGYLKKIPTDPYSDKPIVYKPMEKDFVLYSIGPDFVDNGGQPGKDKEGKYNFGADSGGDIVFWPVQKEPAKVLPSTTPGKN